MRTFLMVVIGSILAVSAYAGLGDIDGREYVDWSSTPYNKIVYFYPKPGFTCTAQYVGPDIILTARHCVTDNTKFDKNVRIGAEFEIWTSDNRRTKVVLEKYGRDFKSDDWALLRVTDSAFHRSDFFNVIDKTTYTNVSSVGFAGLKILSNSEIRQIKSAFSEIIEERGHRVGFGAVMDDVMQKTNINLFDSRVPNSDVPGEWEFRLKRTPSCKINSIDGGRFLHSCDTSGGDSGGAIISGNTLYGIISGGVDSFDDGKNKNFGVRPERYIKDLYKMLRQSPDIVAGDGDDSVAYNTTADDLIATEENINRRMQEVKNMSDRDFFEFLRDGVDMEILKENYERARAREQSTANKLIGAAGIGAGGIGGMMLASGMAEQNADADAETAMRAYLATFTCNYGAGKNVAGGTENVELPGGNELIGLYTEYVTLANDLKRRKEDLGMAPGIESEPILESATSGLYDDVATGKTSGAYASLARALMDPEGEDAKTWAAQKEESAKNVKTGAITAGVGAGGSLVGNMIVNRDKNKDE